MTEKSLPAGMNRRDFLKMAGVATGAMAALPLQAYARFLHDGRPPLRVGIVVPRSPLFPDMGKKLVAGMKLRFAESGWKSTQLLVRESDDSSLIATARLLLTEVQVEILTGMFNPRTVHRLREDLEQTGTLFINIESGANSFVPREESPLMYQNSLGYWQSNWAMGKWAAGNLGRRAAVVSSFYETGYDSFYAFPQGFESAGGTVIRTDITHAPLGGADPVAAMKAVGAARPDCVFVSSSGADAPTLISAYHGAGLTGKIPLVASCFVSHDDLLARMGSAACGILSCQPWTRSLETRESRAFCDAFSRAGGGQPDSFAVLGYDTGGMIVGAVASAAGKGQRSGELKAALEKVRVTSPRGAFGINAATGSSDAPLYICQVRRCGNGFRNAVVGRSSTLHAVEREAARSALVAKSGWTNGYLC